MYDLTIERLTDDLAGITDHDRLTIKIADDIPDHRMRVTVLHELLHACFDLAGRPVEQDVEEDIVLRLSPILAQALSDNRDLVEQIQGEK